MSHLKREAVIQFSDTLVIWAYLIRPKRPPKVLKVYPELIIIIIIYGYIIIYESQVSDLIILIVLNDE